MFDLTFAPGIELDDIIYASCLLASIGAGSYVRKISDNTQRKFLGTGFGLVIVFVLSGWYAFHCLISVALGAIAVIYVQPSDCNLAVFVVMFGYLMFFRLVHLFGFVEPSSHTSVIQMLLTLKVVGIGFEKYACWRKLQQREREETEITDYDVQIQSISLAEIFHYTFNYIGLLTGPYYRYRTYRDYFETPFKSYAPNIEATVDKLICTGIYCALYLLANYLFPFSYVLSNEFYTQRSFFYRLMYMYPTSFIFRMRVYIGLTLSECVCTMAGFGAYPKESDVASGEGPCKQYQYFKRSPQNRSYNFITVDNIYGFIVEMCTTFRDIMRSWNRSVQYWLAVNIYQLFPIKKYRTIATLLCSAYLHGFWPGQYICVIGALYYMSLEDMWNSLVRKDAIGLRRNIIDVIFWISKFFAFSYLSTAFLLVSVSDIWKFYSSVHHIGYLAWYIMMVLGTYLTKQREAEEERRKKAEEKLRKEAEEMLLDIGVLPLITLAGYFCYKAFNKNSY